MSRNPVLAQEIIALLGREHLLSAPQILEKLKDLDMQYNKTSIYRALDKLLADEKICKQSLGDDTILYELRSNHHDHVVCNNCKKVGVVPCHGDEKIAINGFTIEHHHTVMFGTCDECVKN